MDKGSGSTADTAAAKGAATLDVPGVPWPLSPVTVVVGHYGVGKTNLALNLALGAADAGAEVMLADLDVVNPYFRSSDYTALLEERGVRVVAPVLAGTSLDTPSLSGTVATAIEWAQGDAGAAASDAAAPAEGADGLPCAGRRLLVIDAGGDDAGATALGRFAATVLQAPYTMLYVVNCYRNLTQQPAEAVEVLREIEAKSGLMATAVVNNSHLKQDTDEDVIVRAAGFGEEAARLAGLPLAFATVPKSLVERKNPCISTPCTQENVYPVAVFVKTPWE